MTVLTEEAVLGMMLPGKTYQLGQLKRRLGVGGDKLSPLLNRMVKAGRVCRQLRNTNTVYSLPGAIPTGHVFTDDEILVLMIMGRRYLVGEVANLLSVTARSLRSAFCGMVANGRLFSEKRLSYEVYYRPTAEQRDKMRTMRREQEKANAPTKPWVPSKELTRNVERALEAREIPSKFD